MMSDYLTTIVEIAEVYDGPHATPKKIEKGPFFLSISSLEKGYLDLSKSAHLSEEDFKKWTKRVTPKVGDVLFSYETRLGDAALMPPNITACLGRRMGLLRPNTDIVIPEYLLYAYLSPVFQETIRSKTIHGATVDRIALKEVPSFPIRIPPKKEQLRVVSVLNALNSKIELNRQTNQTLEQIAQAIFKSWFVDFEPTRAKIAAKENGQDPERAAMAAISGKSLEELEQLSPDTLQQLKSIAALFPDALVDSELGEIPEGWGVKALDEIANYQNGLALQKFRPENEQDFLPVLKIAQLKKGFANGEEKASPNIKSECIVDSGDVVFSWSGSLIVDVWCGGKVALNQHLFKVTSKEFPKWFYYYWTKHHLNRFQQVAADKAVTMGHIKDVI
jgi:type I restriction enzyme, S subunit